MGLSLNEFVYISLLSCFLIAGVIYFLIHRPVKKVGKDKVENHGETCKGCNRERTHQRLENLETGELLPFCLRCSRGKTVDSDKYLLRSIRNESVSEIPNDLSARDTRKTEYSQPF